MDLVCCGAAGPDMSAAGMLTAINSARLKALPPSLSTAGAAEWQLLEPSTPLVVTALRAAAATGDREAVLSTLQQQMKPIQPTPVEVQVGRAPVSDINALTQGLLCQEWPGISCIGRLHLKMHRLMM